jgi:hypothetical protein
MNSRTSNLYIGNPNPNANDQALTVDATVGGVQFAALHTDTDYVVLDIQDNNARATFDGSAPTASNGHLLVKEQGLITLSANVAKAMKMIRVSSNAIIHLTEFVD